MRVLITCPPMLGMKEQFIPIFQQHNIEVHCPQVTQTLREAELIELVPQFDGWIIGDDPATAQVLRAGKNGKLKAAVKWGIGVDNVDFEACKELGIPITNTPGMFGREVADIAIGYLIGLARQTFVIDREVRQGNWVKPRGMSLAGKRVGLIGYGDIGRQTAKRLSAMEMKINVYDPQYANEPTQQGLQFMTWPMNIGECDFLIFTCALNKNNRHMFNSDIIAKCKIGVRVINVARGPLIDEKALELGLMSGQIHSAALEVFEEEPLSKKSNLKDNNCIFGAHNASNTEEAVIETSNKAIGYLMEYLNINRNE